MKCRRVASVSWAPVDPVLFVRLLTNAPILSALSVYREQESSKHRVDIRAFLALGEDNRARGNPGKPFENQWLEVGRGVPNAKSPITRIGL